MCQYIYARQFRRQKRGEYNVGQRQPIWYVLNFAESACLTMSEGNNKRTFSSTNTHISTESVAQANPAKKPRTTGKLHERHRRTESMHLLI